MNDRNIEIKEVHPVVEKLRLIMRDKNLTQKAMAEYAETGDTQMSKIFKGSLQINLWQLSKIASNLQIILQVFRKIILGLFLWRFAQKLLGVLKKPIAQRLYIF